MNRRQKKKKGLLKVDKRKESKEKKVVVEAPMEEVKEEAPVEELKEEKEEPKDS